ncbi:MAG TPA: DUF1343 domain-containing protein [Bryobacteraceae bacterium]|nr:DUF1343 domain-containing protein [Bryobacteraceae bacterium]
MRIRYLSAVLMLPALLPGRVKTGLDVLVEEDFAPLAGKRVGLIANQNAVTWDHRNIVEVMAASKRVKLAAIFAPEHGFSATSPAGANIESGKESATGVPIHSIYNRGSNRPSPEMLAGIDVLVYDLQEAGARFWTFTTTLGYMMEAAAQRRIPIYVLDRPNPINGIAVEGPMLEEKYISMIGYGLRPVRHGMTVGELAEFFNGENHIGADLHVVKMRGWDRGMWMDQTGLEWIPPSPNLRNLAAAALYPGTCLVETTFISVGRGTDTPFEMFGAPWFHHLELADYLNSRKVPGVRFLARRFSPTEAPYQGQEVMGIDIQLLNRDELNSPRMGLEIIAALLKLHPGKFNFDRKVMLLMGNDRAAELLRQGKTGAEVDEVLRPQLEAFRKLRAKYLLY